MGGFATTSCFVVLIALLGFAQQAEGQTTTPEWRRGASLPLPLAGHATLLLPTGEVLVAGGISADGNATRTSLLYSPITGTFRPTLNMLANSRTHHVLVGAGDAAGSRVFAIGGYAGGTGNYRGEASVEVLEYDAGADNWRWRPVGALGVGRGDLRAAWDGGDFIIVTGGYQQTGGALRSGTRSRAADRITISALRVASIAEMSAARAEHATVRFVGESGGPLVLTAAGENDATAVSTQIIAGAGWDPIANPPLSYHSGGVAVGDPAGIARIFGGFDILSAPTTACEWYDVKRGWRAGPRMAVGRARFDAALVAGPNDSARTYLAVGGSGTGGALADCELFNLPNSSFPNGGWVPFAAMNDRASERRVAIGGDNLPVATGGLSAGSSPMEGVEIFQPLLANDISFGSEEVGRRSDSMIVTIENTWLLPVRARRFRVEGAEFLLRGDTSDFLLPASGSRSLRLYFQPAGPGPRTGRLLFDVGPLTDTVLLSGTGGASDISVLATPVDFGTQIVKTGRTGCFPLLRNNGTDPATVDSVVIDPAGAFRLISPKGRVQILPGDTLVVCVEFAPDARGISSASANVHIAQRTFAGQIFGRGVRRYMTAAAVAVDCDTVTYAQGVESSGFITVENPGDTLLTVQQPIITASTPGLFRVDDASLFPLVLLPGERRQIEIVFTPQRETREVATVAFPNNGDTAAAAALCFVARSRYLSVSQPELDFGSVCTGDTVTARLTIENPGGFEPVVLTGAAVTPDDVLDLEGFAPGVLGPREYTSVSVRFVAAADGPFNGELVVQSSHGELRVPVRGIARPTLRFAPRAGGAEVGSVTTVPVDASGIGPAGLSAATLRMRYDPQLMMPRRIVRLAGGAPVDEAASSLMVKGGGEAALDVAWSGGGMPADGEAFGVEFEILRGDGYLAAVRLEGEGTDLFCLADATSPIAIVPPCVGSGGLIRSDAISDLFASPVPASDKVAVTVVSPQEGEVRLDLVNSLGALAAAQTIGGASQRVRTGEIPVAHLPAGTYLLRATVGGRIIGTRTITVVR